MREIKFRAWDKDLKQMLENVQLTYENGYFGNGSIFHFSFEDVLHDKDLEIMQFTGLQDKKGVDIYEGDKAIISTYDCETPLNDYEGVIDFGAYGTAIYRNREDGTCEFYEFLADLNNCFKMEIEIIGNIHENPELLEGAKVNE